jgi:hypothetical protein
MFISKAAVDKLYFDFYVIPHDLKFLLVSLVPVLATVYTVLFYSIFISKAAVDILYFVLYVIPHDLKFLFVMRI